jgi:hypothetical protein
MVQALILNRAPIGPNFEDYSVLEEGVIVGRIFLSPAAPQDARGCDGTFAKRWRQE